MFKVIMLIFDRLGLAERPVRANSPCGPLGAYRGNLAGGATMGLGMALSGACPGTLLVQLALGVESAKVASLGALLGGMVYSEILAKVLERVPSGPIEKTTIPKKLHVPELVVYALFGATILGIFALTSTSGGGCAIPPALGGVFIGLTQAVSLLLTARPLGVSNAHEQIGLHILRATRLNKSAKPAAPLTHRSPLPWEYFRVA